MSDFDIRLRQYSPTGVRGQVIQAAKIDVTDPFGDTPTLRFTTSLRVAALLATPFVVAVEYRNGGVWAEPLNGRFLVGEDNTDSADPAKTVTFAGISYMPWLLMRTYLGWSSSAKNGQRTWTAQTAGYILTGMFTESANRGWGKISGTPFLTWDFTATNDSNGVAWPTAAADKITQSFPQLTPVWQVVQGFITSGLCEVAFEGNTIHLYNAGSGRDLTATVRLGPGVSTAPARTSFNYVFTDLTVVPQSGKNLVYLANTGADPQFGRLEATLTLSGISDNTVLSTKLAQPALADGKTSKRELTLTYGAAGATWLPWVHYRTGDQLSVKTGSWESLRVAELVVSKDGNEITVTAIMSYRFRALLARLATKQAAAVIGSVGGSGGSGVPLPIGSTPLPDPNPPAGLAGTPTGVWDDSGLPKVNVALSWSAVTQATDTSTVDIDRYEVWGRSPGDVSYVRVSTAGLTANLYNLDPGTLLVMIRALSTGGVWSQFSSEVTLTLVGPTAVLDAPSAPVLTSKLGVVSVRWDGLLSTGAPPAQFRTVFPVMSTSLGGTYAPVGTPLGKAGSTQVSDLTKGSTYWFKFIAVDSRGVASAPSAAASVTVVGVVGPDLVANTLTANEIQAGVGTFEKLSLGAILTPGVTTERVPSPLTDTVFWGNVISGVYPLVTPASGFPQRRATSGSTGVTLTPTPSEDARLYLSAQLPVPATKTLNCSAIPATPVVRTNQCINPSPATTSGWASQQTPTVDTGATWSPSGTALIMTANGVNSAYIFTERSASAVAIGDVITAAVTTGGASGLTNVAVRLHVRSTNAYLTPLIIVSKGTRVVVTWTSNIVIAANDLDIAILGYGSSGGALAPNGAVFLAGAATIEINSVSASGNFFDGSTAPVGDQKYAWGDVPDASTSTETTRRGVRVISFDSGGTPTEADIPVGENLVLPDTAVTYTTYIDAPANTAPVLVQNAHVFEVIGNTPSDSQGVKVSPQGVEMVDAAGNVGVRMGTWDDNLFSTFTLNGLGQMLVQASIDNAGTGTFNDVNANDDFAVGGIPIVGLADSYRVNGVPLTVPLMERGPLGQVFSTGLGTDATAWGESYMQITGTTDYQALGAAKLQLNSGRRYRTSLDAPMRVRWQATPTSTSVLWLEVWVGDTQQVLTAPNGVMRRWRLLDGNDGGGLGTAMKIFPINPSKPYSPASDANGYSYMLARIKRVSSTTSYLIETVGGASENNEPTLTIEDVGSANVDPYVATTKVRTTSGTPSTPGSTTTTQFACTWSQSWGTSGVYTSPSSDTFIDSRLLHQGQSGSKMGLAGWGALGLSSKTISQMRIRLRNRFTGYGTGATIQVGFYTASAPPGGSKPTPQYRFDVHVNKGQTLWITVPTALLASGLAAAIQAGTLRSMTIGVPSGGTNQTNAIFDGQPASNAYGSSLPPLFEFTYA